MASAATSFHGMADSKLAQVRACRMRGILGSQGLVSLIHAIAYSFHSLMVILDPFLMNGLLNYNNRVEADIIGSGVVYMPAVALGDKSPPC